MVQADLNKDHVRTPLGNIHYVRINYEWTKPKFLLEHHVIRIFTHVINEHIFQPRTKENLCIRIEFNSQRISWGHQYGCCSFA